MQPTIEILDRIRKNSKDNKEEIFTRLYRYLLRPDLYYLAYKNLYANKGAGTKPPIAVRETATRKKRNTEGRFVTRPILPRCAARS